MLSLRTGDLITVGNPHQASWIAKREWAQQHRIDHAENGGTGADAEAGDEDGKRSESGIAPHAAKGVAQVLRQVVYPARDPGGASFFRFLCHIAELSARHGASLGLRDALRDQVQRFAAEEVAPIAAELDKTDRFPRELWPRMGALGLHGITVEEEYGGVGLGYLEHVIAVEEISRACANSGVILSVNNSLVCDPIQRFGSEQQKREFLTPLASGRKLGCFGLTEPGAGSDAASLRTLAPLARIT